MSSARESVRPAEASTRLREAEPGEKKSEATPTRSSQGPRGVALPGISGGAGGSHRPPGPAGGRPVHRPDDRQSLKAGWAEPLTGRLDWQLVGRIDLFKDLANGVKQ